MSKSIEFTVEELAASIAAAKERDEKLRAEHPDKKLEELGFILNDPKRVPLPYPVGPNLLTFLVIDVKPDAKKFKLNSKFHPVYVNATHTFKETGETAFVKAKPWFSVTDMPIEKAPADPTDEKDPRNKNKEDASKKPNEYIFESREKTAGVVGSVLMDINVIFKARCTDLGNKRLIDVDDLKFSEVVQTILSKDNEKNPKGKIEDCPLRFKCNFDKFHPSHPDSALRNSVMTPLLQYNGESDDGKLKTLKARVFNPKTGRTEDVNRANVHEFMKRGMMIKRGRFYFDSAVEAAGRFSMGLRAHRLVVDTAVTGGFDDDDIIVEEGDALPPKHTDQPTGSSGAPTDAPDAPAGTGQPPPPGPTSEVVADPDAVQKMLSGLGLGQ